MRIPVLLPTDPTPLVYTTESLGEIKAREQNRQEIAELFSMYSEVSAERQEDSALPAVRQKKSPSVFDTIRFSPGGGDIFKHLIAHADTMQDGQIRREIAKIVQSHIQQNNLTNRMHYQLRDKIQKFFIDESNHDKIVANVTHFALWMEKLSPEFSRDHFDTFPMERKKKIIQKNTIDQNSETVPPPHLNPSSDGPENDVREMLLTLHFDYGVKFVDVVFVESQGGNGGGKGRIVVGEGHTKIPYAKAAVLAREYEKGFELWVDNGPVKGRVRWVDSQGDEVGITEIRYKSTPQKKYYATTFSSVFTALPYLMEVASPMVRAMDPERMKVILRQSVEMISAPQPDPGFDPKGVGRWDLPEENNPKTVTKIEDDEEE